MAGVHRALVGALIVGVGIIIWALAQGIGEIVGHGLHEALVR